MRAAGRRWAAALAALALAVLALAAGDPAAAGAPAEARGPGPRVVRVAAVHDTGALGSPEGPCAVADRACRLEVLVRAAHAEGAAVVVTPEYALELETPVEVGGDEPVLRRFRGLADELDIVLVLALQTQGRALPRNSQVALGPDGRILAVHHKIELFDGERATMEAGTDVVAFDTPHGRMGLLVCADLYAAPALHARLTGMLGAELVLVSAWWTVEGALAWPAAFAHDWQRPVVFANGSAEDARGSGIFDKTGAPLATSRSPVAGVVVADVAL